ncbi:MAG: proline dehydrogenase family protein [Chitinophagaceae bacterium]
MKKRSKELILLAMTQPISFENTEIAFAHKTNSELKKAHWLFRLMANPWLVKLSTVLAPWSIRAGLPVKGMIRETIFRQFVGGETLDQTGVIAKKLSSSRVQVILDYGVEGKEGEAAFDAAQKAFLGVIEYAASQPNIPYISIKVTGLARFTLLERIDALMHLHHAGSLVESYHAALAQLSQSEKEEWARVVARAENLCAAAASKKVGLLVDAEETWIQDGVDALTMLMMDGFNKEAAVVYNTMQLYRHDRIQFLQQSLQAAGERKFILGVKLVRGAYMEKERKRAEALNYASPIQPGKAASDKDYNEAVRHCINHLTNTAVIVATHNEDSNMLAVTLMKELNFPLAHPHLHFSQLYGMSDNITYNLARAGCNVSKYLPFGPIEDVVPYLMRRAQENTSVGGQTSRELGLIKKELDRRRLAV